MKLVKLKGIYQAALLARPDVVAAGIETKESGNMLIGKVVEHYSPKSGRRPYHWMPQSGKNMEELRIKIQKRIRLICHEFFYEQAERKGDRNVKAKV